MVYSSGTLSLVRYLLCQIGRRLGGKLFPRDHSSKVEIDSALVLLSEPVHFGRVFLCQGLNE